MFLRKVCRFSKHSNKLDEHLVERVKKSDSYDIHIGSQHINAQKDYTMQAGICAINLSAAGKSCQPHSKPVSQLVSLFSNGNAFKSSGSVSTSSEALSKVAFPNIDRSSTRGNISQRTPLSNGLNSLGVSFTKGLTKLAAGYNPIRFAQCRTLSTKVPSKENMNDGCQLTVLCDQIEELIEKKLQQVKRLRTTYGNVKVAETTLSQVLGGMRDMIAMNCETSELDANTGITYRGMTIKEVLEKLPAFTKGSNCPYSEAILWLLLTGKIPNLDEVKMLSDYMAKRAKVPEYVFDVIDQLPTDCHPMTQFILASAAMQSGSVFSAAYREKSFTKGTAWRLVLEDAIRLIAQNSLILPYIYKRTFVDKTIKKGKGMVYDPNEDYASNVARLLGVNTTEFKDFMRLYIAVHADHEGGNVSAHSSLLIGSALSDPYLAFVGAMAGLAGPLHGLANQECLAWVKNMVKELDGQDITVEAVTKFAQESLQKGQVIPGYGHAVLRVTDPRHDAFVEFAHRMFPDDPLVKILDKCVAAIPPVLAATGKVKSPYPNVDCSTGILLSHFGVTEPNIFTLFFGVSRAFGIMSQLVWSRALGMPIERPKSHTLDTLEKMFT
ncbi:citrate synthase [Babesia gibsoni]|uniref:Citrate synthase n=1 Tax=Babesia gibsoni TaxID=33632 RepID=A0AAD8PED6_BABGI|nr:citrate synthase [Babesia gibsoni]